MDLGLLANFAFSAIYMRDWISHGYFRQGGAPVTVSIFCSSFEFRHNGVGFHLSWRSRGFLVVAPKSLLPAAHSQYGAAVTVSFCSSSPPFRRDGIGFYLSWRSRGFWGQALVSFIWRSHFGAHCWLLIWGSGSRFYLSLLLRVSP